jgi:hypothetical protein
MKSSVFPVICFLVLMGIMVTLPLQSPNSGVAVAAAGDSSPSPAVPTDHAQTFSGKIISMNGAYYVLRDDANQTWYHLDDQAKARPFFGKNVAVKGVLDGRTDVIHVSDIKEL